jgi:hypothetical protein
MTILLQPHFLIVVIALIVVTVVAVLSPPARMAFARAFSQPGFFAAAAVLLVAALSLNAATTFMQLNFKKLPVDPGQDLTKIPAQMGYWHLVSNDEPLSGDIEETLGTKVYIFRDYVDERIVGRELIEQFQDKSTTERRRMLAQLQGRYPEAVVNLAVTYYTGLVDTVAHVPDRCYIAGGFQPSSYQSPTWLLAGERPEEDRQIEVRYIQFEDQTGYSMVSRNVAYFFHVNGRYESSPLGVRRSLQNLFERHGYYAKVELMTIVRDSGESARIMSDFLAASLPEIEKCWPDWNSLRAGDVK